MSMPIEMLTEGRSVDGQRWDKKIRVPNSGHYGRHFGLGEDYQVCVSPGPNPTVLMPVSEAGSD